MKPTSPDLALAEECYRRGDFLEARRIAKAIVSAEDLPAAEKTRAAEILAATGTDPVAIAAFLVTALLLAFLIARYVV